MKPRLCHRVDCSNQTSGRAVYCSAKCSAVVRNRRYYRTIKGRLKKQELARGYFQRHKQKLYDKRAARLAELFRAEMAAEMRCHNIREQDVDVVLPILVARTAPGVMRNVRFHHDFHPQQFRDWHGKVRWQVDWADGKLKRYWVRGPYREELAGARISATMG